MYKQPSRELKFLDTSLNDASVSINGSVLIDTLNLLQEGTGEDERIGRKVVATSLHIRYTFVLLAQLGGAVQSGESVRIVVYQDKQANGLPAAVLDVFEVNDYQTYRNLSNINRFNILYDRTHEMNSTSAAMGAVFHTWPAVVKNWTFNKQFNIPIEYSNTAGLLANIRSNNIGMILFSQAGGRTSFTGLGRIRYTDQ